MGDISRVHLTKPPALNGMRNEYRQTGSAVLWCMLGR